MTLTNQSVGRKTSDPTAESEAYGALMASVPFRSIDDERAFYEVVSLYDRLLGRTFPSSLRIDDVINDRSRSWYLYLTASVLHETRLTVAELARVLRRMVEVRDEDASRGSSRSGSRSSRAKKAAPVKVDSLRNAIVGFCRHCDFEPAWHVARRGDERALPSSKGKDLWGYLRRLYTDPEASRLRIPDVATRLAPMYPGYMDCVRSAIRAGHEELKRVYGEDVDLSPVTEIKGSVVDGVDYGGIGSSFMSLLNKGSLD